MTIVALAFIRKHWLGSTAFLAVTVALFAILGGAGRWQAERQARESALARAGVIVGQAGAGAARAATEAVAGLGEREAARTETTQENRVAILAATYARDDAGAAGDAGLAGLCRRAVYRDHPRCAGLRRPDPAAAAR